MYGVIKETVNGVSWTVTCEADWPKDPKVYEVQMRLFRTKYPYGVGGDDGRDRRTAPTGRSPRRRSSSNLRRKGYPIGLVIQAEFDLSTQYDGGPAMASVLDNSLVSVKDEGSDGMYGRNSCVTRKVNDYLTEGILPGPRVV